MKFILKLSLAILLLAPVSGETTQASSDVILVKQERILKEEYQMVRQMRHRLRYLLEQQDMENTLQEGEDVFQDLQQLEQWLEEMKRNPENANMEALMQMMQQLEQRMNESLAEQEQTQQWLNSQNSQTPQQQQQQIPLSSLMEAMRELIRQQRFDEAQQLLDQLMTALNRQQQDLQQSLAQNNQQRFSQTNRDLQQMMSQAQQALSRENQVRKMLEPHNASQKLPEDVAKQAAELQRQISELIRKMQSGLMQLPESSMLNTRTPRRELQLGMQASSDTEGNLKNSVPMPSFQSAGDAKNSLERLTQNLNQLQQQAQQMSNNQMMAQREGGGRRYWSEKSVRPMKFEYEFQANPLFREKIQNQQGQDSQRRTKLQQQYLQEVMR